VGLPVPHRRGGVGRGTASALLTLFVLSGMVAGPAIGVLVERHPLRRSWLVLGVAGANALGWALVLAWPGAAAGAGRARPGVEPRWPRFHDRIRVRRTFNRT
jgi:hypothetical protein